jgi:hypothetical protein
MFRKAAGSSSMKRVFPSSTTTGCRDCTSARNQLLLQPLKRVHSWMDSAKNSGAILVRLALRNCLAVQEEDTHNMQHVTRFSHLGGSMHAKCWNDAPAHCGKYRRRAPARLLHNKAKQASKQASTCTKEPHCAIDQRARSTSRRSLPHLLISKYKQACSATQIRAGGLSKFKK